MLNFAVQLSLRSRNHSFRETEESVRPLRSDSRKAAETYADPSLDKGSYKKFLDDLNESLEKEVISLSETNLNILSSKCLQVISTLKLAFISRTGSDHVKLPTFEESLRTQLNLDYKYEIYREYTDHLRIPCISE